MWEAGWPPVLPDGAHLMRRPCPLPPARCHRPFGVATREEQDCFVIETQYPQGLVAVTKYASRHWAVWLSGELVAVMLYKKGALRVAELLKDRPALK